ncbi:MAG: hypothetical protein ACR2GL_07815 [Thermoleophilaceae bacterium]
MRPTTKDPRGGGRGRGSTLGLATMLPGLVLVVVIFWALAAVLMLTGTLINAREIDETVDVINAQVSPIDEELNNVKVLEEVTRSTVRIDAAAKPLSGQADQILSAAGAIDKSVKSILGTAGSINETAKSINETAKSINGTVSSINGTVNSIGSTVVSINGTVNSIGSSVSSINRLAGTILATVGRADATDATSINASVGRILTSLRSIDRLTKRIDNGGPTGGAAAINRRADRAIDVVTAVNGDTEGILADVGFGTTADGSPDHGRGNIHGHANSIDCSPLLNIIGMTPYCNQ